MFVAKFQQVAVGSGNFKADKNNEMPFIGTVVAGTAQGSIINGTMFHREGLEPNKLYACENSIETYEGKETIQTEVLAEVSVIELIAFRKEFGAGKSVYTKTPVTAEGGDTPE